MKNWFEYIKNQALIIFPNMPTSYIENAVIKAASRFFRDTNLLTDDAYIDVNCGVNEYIIDIPTGRGIVKVKQVRSHTNPDVSPLVDSSWCVLHPAEHRFGYGWWVSLQHSVPTIYFDGVGIRQGKYCVTYSWTPADGNCDLPQHFMTKYADGILNGVLYELYMIPMEFDSQSPNLAQHYLRAFHSAINNAGAEELQNHSDRPLFMQGGTFI